jgi:very-short-patch-repair endonuclease
MRLGLTTPEALQAYARERHLDGVVLTRRTSLLVRSRVDSVKETDVRLVLVASGLPEPEVNGTIADGRGRFLARGDLVYRGLRIVIEYDGWHHDRSADQRRRDILRRPALVR